ncbi:SWIM zinc finger family protein [Euzebya rosea]|uniref:SWIM zinc finger family protein n=1 Tax=Euzebya rosea TaxID=2052804 RepID=UPI000D3E7614|nr:SWIM zinc finger family protein [Euzebya rosea]
MVDERWGPQRVRDYAPDASSFAAAKKLARSAAWSGLGRLDQLLWGRCQGSGATPYRVSVDLSGPSVTCTCPSRKQPCKHGLSLLLVWLADVDGFGSTTDAPEDVLAAARQRASRAVTEDRRAPVDPEARARRVAKRLALMDGGMVELRQWLDDVIVDGLAATRSRPHAWWDLVGARLVDAQLPGLADRVRALPTTIAGRDDWASVLLSELGRLHLTVAAWERRGDLPQADAADLRTFLGWARPTAEVLDGERLAGEWTVLGIGTSDTGRVVEQRTWLHHPVEGHVILLDFAGGTATPPTPQLLGSILEVEMAMYPGRPPRRVRFADDPVTVGEADELPVSEEGWAAALRSVADLAADAPWQDRFPCTVAGVRLVDADADSPRVVDRAGGALPAVGLDPWATLAITGGRPATMFGEVLHDAFRPLTVAIDGRLLAVPVLQDTARWQDRTA